MTETPSQTPETVILSPAGTAFASLKNRIFAAIVDSIVSSVLFAIIYGLLGGYSSTSDNGSPAFLSFLFMIAYLTVLEGMRGQTLGKMLLKIKVIKEDGEKISYKDALTRNALLIFDDFFFGLVGIISINNSKIKQRVGDQVAHTIVVDA